MQFDRTQILQKADQKSVDLCWGFQVNQMPGTINHLTDTINLFFAFRQKASNLKPLQRIDLVEVLQFCVQLGMFLLQLPRLFEKSL